ncbi:MAG: glycosyl hydrolase-related protein [Promethearchaeota archaeon]
MSSIKNGNVKDSLNKKDVNALVKVFELIERFIEKNPLESTKKKVKKVKKKLEKLKASKTNQEELPIIYNRLIKTLRSLIKSEITSELFYIIGGHGGIIIKGHGFCEFDSPSFALERLIERMELAKETNNPYNIEVAISCLDWLYRHHSEKFLRFKELFESGKFEIINPTWSQPYALIIGAESNIKQFEVGLKALRELGLTSGLYYASESSLHPQMPQILKNFNISRISLRARLLGVNPTAISPRITWIGLDDTKIDAIIDQSGLYNGEYFHGTFFQEFPGMLFQAVSRPFVKEILYSSLEDFVMPLPFQEEVWRVNARGEIFGKFITCSEAFEYLFLNGEYKYRRDDFLIGDYIFNTPDLLLQNKNAEIILITAEITNCLATLADPSENVENDAFLENCWRNLLLTQAHDCHAVPFIRTGDYSSRQLDKEEFNKLKLNACEYSISQLSIKILEELQEQCAKFIEKNLEKIIDNLEGKKSSEKKYPDVVVFNPTSISRKELVEIELDLPKLQNLSMNGGSNESIPFEFMDGKLYFLIEVPAFGYSICTFQEIKEIQRSIMPEFYYNVEVLKDGETIQISFKEKPIMNLKFNSDLPYQLTLQREHLNRVFKCKEILGKVNDSKQQFKLTIIQQEKGERLEFRLEASILKELILQPEIQINETHVNYPFGIEKTCRTKIQALDFLWLKGSDDGILFIQKNSPQFLINRESFVIRNVLKKARVHEFCIACTSKKNPYHLMNIVQSYYYKFLTIIKASDIDFSVKKQSFLQIEPNVSVINFWRKKNNIFIRLFNPDDKKATITIQGVLIPDTIEKVNFLLEKLAILEEPTFTINPWEILTLKLK